ncbi:MAG: hypothetical protein AAFW46_13565 [Pseudomonadota bacterium]
MPFSSVAEVAKRLDPATLSALASHFGSDLFERVAAAGRTDEALFSLSAALINCDAPPSRLLRYCLGGFLQFDMPGVRKIMGSLPDMPASALEVYDNAPSSIEAAARLFLQHPKEFERVMLIQQSETRLRVRDASSFSLSSPLSSLAEPSADESDEFKRAVLLAFSSIRPNCRFQYYFFKRRVADSKMGATRPLTHVLLCVEDRERSELCFVEDDRLEFLSRCRAITANIVFDHERRRVDVEASIGQSGRRKILAAFLLHCAKEPVDCAQLHEFEIRIGALRSEKQLSIPHNSDIRRVLVSRFSVDDHVGVLHEYTHFGELVIADAARMRCALDECDDLGRRAHAAFHDPELRLRRVDLLVEVGQSANGVAAWRGADAVFPLRVGPSRVRLKLSSKSAPGLSDLEQDLADQIRALFLEWRVFVDPKVEQPKMDLRWISSPFSRNYSPPQRDASPDALSRARRATPTRAEPTSRRRPAPAVLPKKRDPAA